MAAVAKAGLMWAFRDCYAMVKMTWLQRQNNKPATKIDMEALKRDIEKRVPRGVSI